jgi:hypothetical protein
VSNDALDNIKRLRDVLNEAIAAMEEGREVRIEQKLPYGGVWDEMFEFAQRDYRCVIKPREGWVTEYAGDKWAVWSTREEADKRAMSDRIRCTRFVEAPNDEP